MASALPTNRDNGHPRVVAQDPQQSNRSGLEENEITGLQKQVDQLKAEGKYDNARPLAERLLELRKAALKSPHAEIALSYSDLGEISYVQGDYDGALSLFDRALAMRKQVLGVEHPLVAESLNNLAAVYIAKGDLVRSEPLLQRSLAIREKVLKPNHYDTAYTLNNLASLYDARGDQSRAEPLYRRALAIWEQTSGPESSEVTMVLNNLAALYINSAKFGLAEPLLKRVLEIDERRPNVSEVEILPALLNLALVHKEKGSYDKAEPVYRRALEIAEKALGSEHPDVATALAGLADLYRLMKRYKEAEPLYLRSLAIREKALGSKHPEVATILTRMSILYEREHKSAESVNAQLRANEIRENNLSLVLAVGSEQQKRLYWNKLAEETDPTITLHLHSFPQSIDAANLAFTTILRRKGRVLDAMTNSIGLLRQHFGPEERSLLEQLSTTRAQLATLVLWRTGSGDSAEQMAKVARLETDEQRLEAAISSRSSEYRAIVEPVTIESVRRALPEQTALLEIFLYHPLNSWGTTSKESFDPPRYAAYVLHQDGRLNWVDLGLAQGIDRKVAALRAALSDPGSVEYQPASRRLDEELMRPIRQLLGPTKRILVSPDGPLNLIPFAALIDENGHFLIESYTITYLSSGRDLLRLQTHTESRQQPVIVANPAYSMYPADSSAAGRNGQRSVDLARVRFRRLPGTAEEAKDLSELFPQALLLTNKQATEAAMKQLHGPSFLHIATHGFFFSEEQGRSDSSRGITVGSEPTALLPMWRAGLVFAGVNQRQSGAGEDGVLSALEATGLDLWGTKLVVLSACDTGVGDVRSGDGVFGLRRAFTLAGAESLVMTLWEVDDAATRQQMVLYYGRLKGGMARADALREVQLEFLHGGNGRFKSSTSSVKQNAGSRWNHSWSHPYYWASFIQSGAWSSLSDEGKNTLSH